jgi:hypothetical protein
VLCNSSWERHLDIKRIMRHHKQALALFEWQQAWEGQLLRERGGRLVCAVALHAFHSFGEDESQEGPQTTAFVHLAFMCRVVDSRIAQSLARSRGHVMHGGTQYKRTTCGQLWPQLVLDCRHMLVDVQLNGNCWQGRDAEARHERVSGDRKNNW